jgi:hypothetical protein
MTGKSSADLLRALFTRFQRRALAETGVKLSMRKVSEELLSRPAPEASAVDSAPASRKPDANALGRWTKPGDRRNWHIPVGRILDVAQHLQATPAERDALMLARLQEVADTEPTHEVLVCGAWVAGRVQEQNELDVDEQAVLSAFRKARAVSPYSMLTAERVARLEAVFADLAKEHLAEVAAGEDEPTPGDDVPVDVGLRERALAAVRKVGRPSKPEAALSAEVLARRFLRSLRQPRP